MANIPYPNIPYPRLSCWWVLNLFCDKRYQITFKIQNDDIYKMLNFLMTTYLVEYPPTTEPWIGYIGIRDICHFIFRDMGYVSSELLGYGIFAYFFLGIRDIDTIQGSVVGRYSNLFCDKRYQITFKIQDDDIYKMLNFLIDNTILGIWDICLFCFRNTGY
jgi:hypothetical protein